MTLKLSVLDLVPVRTDQTSGDALRATLRLAAVADDLGLHRYWLAEHHNMPAVAATNPPVLIAMVAAATSRIRVGSGGVMLPNHAPLVVAEQFGLLEAAYPGRIDLGIGRAPGSDPVTSWALRYGAGGVEEERRRTASRSTSRNVIAMLGRGGVGLRRGRAHLPAAGDAGRDARSRRCGCSGPRTTPRGWPPSRACPTSSRTTSPATARPRRWRCTATGFRPPRRATEPTTFLTANVVVAATDEEAERLARPQLLAMLALRTGAELGPQHLVEEAEAVVVPAEHADAVRRDAAAAGWSASADEVAGAGRGAGRRRSRVDEVMVHPVAGAYTGTDPDSSPTREESLRLLAKAL